MIVKDEDVSIKITRGTGNGGQNRNKVAHCVVMTHLHTNLVVKIDGRSLDANLKEAKKILTERLKDQYQKEYDKKYSSLRKDQIGDTFRGNKRRTYNQKANEVIDHLNNKSTTWKEIMKGNISILHRN